MNPFVGYVIDKIDRMRTIIAIGGLALAILMVGVTMSINWIMTLALLIGLAMV
ncbi:hypothetical protein ACFLU8_01670 [Chloroflexota bacterium]